MASSRGVAHFSRELLNKLVGIVTDPRLPPQRKLDRAMATLDRVVRDADSPASAARGALVAALDDAISTVAELTHGGVARPEIEARVHAKLAASFADVRGVSLEAGP